jgi:hypothetical protein
MDTKALSRKELQDMLASLKRLRDAGTEDLFRIKAQIEALQQEFTEVSRTGGNIAGSIKAIEKTLGLQPTEEVSSPEAPVSAAVGGLDNTQAVMRIVAEHNDKGGIDIDGISDLLKERGVFLKSRDYLHTILNRKKNQQKKLAKVSGKWFLTEKGKTEVRMN